MTPFYHATNTYYSLWMKKLNHFNKRRSAIVNILRVILKFYLLFISLPSHLEWELYVWQTVSSVKSRFNLFKHRIIQVTLSIYIKPWSSYFPLCSNPTSDPYWYECQICCVKFIPIKFAGHWGRVDISAFYQWQTRLVINHSPKLLLSG